MTKRSQMLRAALRQIDGGGDDTYQGAAENGPSRETSRDSEVIARIITRIMDDSSTQEALSRTAISSGSSDAVWPRGAKELVDSLSPEGRDHFRSLLEEVLEQMRRGELVVLSESEKIVERLDRHYASEILQKLDTIVDRAVRLERHSLSQVLSQSVRLAFQDAHQCYLYGFHSSCVVFCRSLLEAALREAIDPLHKEERTLSGLIERAEKVGMLEGSLLSAANDINKYGNLAVHDPSAFSRRCPPDRVFEILVTSRCILGAVYPNERCNQE